MTETAAQGTEQWHQDRLGKVTASRLKDMMTRDRKKQWPGQTALSYMWDLIGERLTGQPSDILDGIRAIEWGKMNEPAGRQMYCFHHDVRVTLVGFVDHPTINGVGGSPDGLVEGDPEGPGGLELKCPMTPRIHLQRIYEGVIPKDDRLQVQGCMWVTGRKWWDYCSYYGRMPENLQLFIIREYADDELHDELAQTASRFLEQIEVKLNKIKGQE